MATGVSQRYVIDLGVAEGGLGGSKREGTTPISRDAPETGWPESPGRASGGVPAPLLRRKEWVTHGGVGAGEEGGDRESGQDLDRAAVGVLSVVDPTYGTRGMDPVLASTGLEQVPGLHPGVRPACDAVSKGELLRVRNGNSEAVSALLSCPRQSTETPVSDARVALVLI